MRCAFLSALLVVLAFLTCTIVIKAQSSSEDFKLEYRKALDNYRANEDQFNIASQQYYALKTLASQEEAVRSSREVDLARVDTVSTYIKALRFNLDNNPGIELARKTLLQKQFDLLVESLDAHRARLEIVTNRIALEQENVFFENQQELILSLCYQALSLIKIGAIQTALDSLVVTQDQVSDFIATADVSETVRQEKKRGNDELSRSIDAIKISIANALDAYDAGRVQANHSLFSNVQNLLGVAYANLTQAAEFIKELTQ